MTAPHPVAPQPLLLAGASGPLCALYFAPAAGSPPLGDVLVVPPFAEEMHRCRAMVAMQARSLALAGVGTLLIDPFGTGDSAGEFADATWAGWLDDLRCGVAWLDQHGQGCRALLAIRLGAILAQALLRDAPAVRQLVLWQPVLSGKTFQTQFLRIRIAAEINQPDRIKTTNELRAMSAAGQAVEVSGYAVGAALAQALDGAVFNADTLRPPLQTSWFEVVADAAAPVSLASAKAIEAFRAAGAVFHFEQVAGPSFWHVHERALAPGLVQRTTQRLADGLKDGLADGSTAGSTAGPAPGSTQPVAAVTTVTTPTTATTSPADPAERPLIVACGSHHLSALLHRGDGQQPRAVVIVVAGGPQYRAGAHRQFVSLARKLAGHGHAVLRFDLRGMGDSSGSYLGFEQSEPDIRAAIDALLQHAPQVREVVLVGECESASGILFYAWRDPRVAGAVLVNPWVRTEEGQAQVIINHYYLDRLRSPEFWATVRRGQFDVLASLTSLMAVLRAYVRGKRMFAKSNANHLQDDISGLPLPVRTAVGLSRFKGQVLLLMSGHDYIAREFDEVTAASRAWDGLLGADRVQRCDIDGADHTFSKAHWKSAASDAVVGWLQRW